MATKKQSKDDDKILREAKDRFTRAEAWESKTRQRQIDDLKFCEADSYNLYQWPEGIRTRMENQTRAMLTINKTKQHCLDIENDARQSRVAIKVRPTGGGSSYDSAMIFEDVIRHIEYISNAGVAYQNGLRFAIRSGIGWWRIVTEYANDDSFDQEIFIRPVKDPQSVYLDDNINEFDGSDAMWGIVFTDTPREEFERANPEWKGKSAGTNWGPQTWVTQDIVRTAEYFRRKEHKERLFAFPDPSDQSGESQKVVRESEITPELGKMLADHPDTKVRHVKSHKVQWFKIIGDEVVERRDWLGIYIPLVRCIGEETVIDGELDRKGHTRALLDPQRMFNYNASGSVEFGALQSKTPYIGPADAIEGFETDWENSNIENKAYLAFNHRDDDGEDIPAPVRQQPPSGAPVYMEGMKDAAEWMRMVSGQYSPDMGAPSGERSGKAINALQRQGDNSSFHFLDHQSIAIRYTAKQLVDLVPKVYDTERVLLVMAEDGTTEQQLKIDPNQQQAMQQAEETRDKVKAIFNPKVGKYEVEADVGPAYQTQRQEAFEAYTQLLANNKELVNVIGDIALRFGDFPGAEEAAARLKRMVPAQALQDGPAPDLVKAQQQVQALTNMVSELTKKLTDKTGDLTAKAEKNAVDGYRAQNDRMTALKEHLATNPELLVSLVRQVLEEAEATSEMGLGLPPGSGPAAASAQPALAPAADPAGPSGAAPPGAMGEPNMSDQDMGSGPAAAPGGAPQG